VTVSIAIALLACSGGPPEPIGPLVRASMSVRGVRPSLDEIEAVRADPARLEDIVVGWFDDPRFGETVRDMHAEQMLMRIDTRDHLRPLGPLAAFSEAEITASLDEEPLRMIERIVTEGRPYTEIVTGGTAMASAITSAAHGLSWGGPTRGLSWGGPTQGLSHSSSGPEWQESTWSDGRPTAGILSSTSLWQRHMSSNVNLHRSRANFVLSELLCQPFPPGNVISRPEPEPGQGDALTENPGCAGCHQTLDPLASVFYGFRDYVLPSDNAQAEERGCPPEGAWACTPLTFWDPELVGLRELEGMPPPALFGEPVSDLADLGRKIAARPEFAACTARRFAGWLGQVPPEDVPEEDVERLVDALVAADWDARALVLAVVLDPEFSSPGFAAREPLRVRPEQLARMIEDLTGWRWTDVVGGYGQVDLLNTDGHGYRMLAGGVNGWDSVQPVHAPTASRELVLARVAEQAAAHAVDTGLWPPGGVVTGRREVRRALEHLSLRVTGREVDTEALEALFEGALERSGSAEHAWKVTITALLLDPAAERY
jgi:hypothetical protein